MKHQRRIRFPLHSAVATVCLLLVPCAALADPAKDFEKLEEQMETAFEQYVAALAKRTDAQRAQGTSVPDARLDVLQKMDALALAHAGKPEGAEPAVKTFIWSAMFEMDTDRLIERFERIVKNYANHDGTEEVVAMVPDLYRVSGSPERWIAGLKVISTTTDQKSVQLSATYAAGQLALQTGKLHDAKQAFELAVKLDPQSELAELAKGFSYEIEHLQIGMTAPGFTTTTLDGKQISLKQLRGKVVLLDFWATWCGPCLGEIPHLKEAAKHFEGKPFEILGVSLDDFEEMLETTLEHQQLPGIHTWEDVGRDNKVATLYNAQVLPTWYLIDAKGVIRAKDTFGDALIPAVQELLGHE